MQSSCFATFFIMRTRYKTYDSQAPYFLTSTIIAWVPVFTRRPYFDIILTALKYCRLEKGLKIFAYVIMDNHLHLIGQAENLSAILKDFKSFTAREIIRQAEQDDKQWLLQQFDCYKKEYKQGSKFQVWQEGFHPKLLGSEDMVRQKIAYIHHNPVRAGLVDQPEDWPYSSARNYLSGAGVLDIDPIVL